MHNGDVHGDHADGEHSEHAPAGREPRGFAETFAIPLAIPLGAGLVILAIILSVSQILLALPASAATTVAMLIALAILMGCAFFATAKQVSRTTVYAGLALPALALGIAGIGARIYRVNNPAQKEAGAAAKIPDEVTTDNKFSTAAYVIDAGAPITINVRNNGSNQHNMHIVDAQGPDGNDVKTDLLGPGGAAQLSFTIATPGAYHFRCDVHPTEMLGTITVNPAPPAGATAGAPGAGPTETTTDNKFSQTTITVKAGAPTTLTVDNKGAGPHNWDVIGQKSIDGSDIKAPLVEGGKTGSITFEIDKPGSYPFQCDVHPEMKGTLVVQ